MNTGFLLTAILLLIAGFTVRYTVNKRRFYRRNAAGLEQFKSYESAVGTRLFEKFLKFIGFLLILGGLFALFVAYNLPRLHHGQHETRHINKDNTPK